MARALGRSLIGVLVVGWLVLAVSTQTMADFKAAVPDSYGGPTAVDGQWLTEAMEVFRKTASTWTKAAQRAAEAIFWHLATISMAWTGIQLLLRRADLGEIAREIVQFMIFTGFWAWMMRNAPEHARIIIEGMLQVGADMVGVERAQISPSGVLDIAFEVFNRCISASNWFKAPGVFFVGIIIVVMLTIVAANLLQVLAAGWIVAYGGVVVLGFGGCKWTSDIAIAYYRGCLSIGLSALATVLIVGAGEEFMAMMLRQMDSPVFTSAHAVVLLMSAVILAMLATKVPPQIAALASGSGGMQTGLFTMASGTAPMSMVLGPALGIATSVVGSTVAQAVAEGFGRDMAKASGPNDKQGEGQSRSDSWAEQGSAFGSNAASEMAVSVDGKLEQASELKAAVEFSEPEAEQAGAFVEPALEVGGAAATRQIDLDAAASPQSDARPQSDAKRGGSTRGGEEEVQGGGRAEPQGSLAAEAPNQSRSGSDAEVGTASAVEGPKPPLHVQAEQSPTSEGAPIAGTKSGLPGSTDEVTLVQSDGAQGQVDGSGTLERVPGGDSQPSGAAAFVSVGTEGLRASAAGVGGERVQATGSSHGSPNGPSSHADPTPGERPAGAPQQVAGTSAGAAEPGAVLVSVPVSEAAWRSEVEAFRDGKPKP